MKLQHIPAIVAALMPAVPAQARETSFEISTGYRTDTLQWSIAADRTGTTTPNILSELTWSDLRIADLTLSGRFTDPTGEQLRVMAGYGEIYRGKNQDSDYSGNNRTFEWSRSENRSDGDNVLDLSVAGGHRIELRGAFTVTPLLGYSYHEQNLRMTDGNQTVSEPASAPSGFSPQPVGPFAGLNSTYKARWKGPWLGLEATKALNASVSAALELQYHWADYYGVADWNLRSDFAHPKSFEHEADGEGAVMALSLYLPVEPRRWTGNITFDYQKWKTEPGIDRVFHANGAVSTTRLNEVTWKSWSISLGLQRHF